MTRKRLTQAELIDDFKQYVAITVTNTVTDIVTDAVHGSEMRIKKELRAETAELRTEVREGFASIAEIFDFHQKQLNGHDRAIKRLQAKAT